MRIFVDGRIFKKTMGGIRVASEQIISQLLTHSQITTYCFNVEKHHLPLRLQSEVQIASIDDINDESVVWSPNHKISRKIPAHIPVVLTVHDLVWKVMPETMRWRTLLGENFFFPYSVNRANHIICVSKNTQYDLHKYFPSTKHKSSVVHQGSCKIAVRSQYFGKPYVLFVGTFEPRKNINLYLNAISKLPVELLEEVEFVIAGSYGWGMESIYKLINKYKLNTVIRLVSSPSEKLLHELYSNCEFLCMPSLYEGFGLPVVEAMAAGKPSLVSNNSCFEEVAGNSGVYIDPLDVDNIAQGLEQLLSDKDLYVEKKRHAIQRSKIFTWENTTNGMIEVFEQFI